MGHRQGTADHPTMEMLKMLYEKEIFELSGLFIELMQKRDRQGTLDEKNQNLYDWVEKVRRRKAEDREF